MSNYLFLIFLFIAISISNFVSAEIKQGKWSFQIDSNYMYLAYPPNVNNPLIIGEWPYYVIYWEFIIVIFTYTTYVISTRRKVCFKKQ